MDDIQTLLKQYWGYEQFRPLQESIIRSVLDNKDTLALMPTGGGKSICYQVPALARPGITIVVSPLIALMKDQVFQLRRRGIKAAAVFSGMHYREIDITLDNCIYGNYKLLYVSPERLQTPLFKERASKMPINLLAVDEAHCISQWGYDFRPPYLKIAEFRELIPQVPVLALTATATPEVQKDIMEKLEFRHANVFRMSYERKNLAYVVFNVEDKYAKIKEILTKVRGSALIYVRSRRKTVELSRLLQQWGFSAAAYHAGMEGKARNKIQDEWLKDKYRVMVCTNAFGMGIDKPDVRCVLHIDLPDSPEAYFQEAGRAGRDGKKAYAVLLYNAADILEAQKRLESAFPTIEELGDIFDLLCHHYQLPVGGGQWLSFPFDLSAFALKYNRSPLKIHKAISLLEQQGIITLSDHTSLASRVKMRVNSANLQKLHLGNTRLEEVLKMLLRTSPGIFDHFVKIDERRLAGALGLSQEALVASLQQLDKQEIIDYVEQTDLPRITFLIDRVEKQYLPIDRSFLKQRKKAHDLRLKAMLDYVRNTTACRSVLLLQYLGQSNASRCGKCDYCLRHKRSNLKNQEFESLRMMIKSKLGDQPVEIKELVSSIPGTNPEKVLKVIEWLVDNGLIIEESNKLKWVH